MSDLITAVFTKVPTIYLIIGSTLLALFMGTLALFVRSKAANYPVSSKKIILPPLFMSTGAFMFFFEEFRVPFLQVGEALLVGLLFSIVLIKTTHFETRPEGIFIKKSKVFILILVSLLILRLIAKVMLSSTIDVGELGGMFWILAFGMIVPWRIAMLIRFNKLKNEIII
ncbi:CcdC family protein [Sporosarcina sp. CAU 1771]